MLLNEFERGCKVFVSLCYLDAISMMLLGKSGYIYVGGVPCCFDCVKVGHTNGVYRSDIAELEGFNVFQCVGMYLRTYTRGRG